MGTPLDLTLPGGELTAALVDVPSISGGEGPLADLVCGALRDLPHLGLERDGDAVVARTQLGHGSRVVIAGHLDTVPIAGNVPSRREGDLLYGCGTSDMKSGIAVMLRLAALVSQPSRDVSFICYDQEEVDAERNGLGRLARRHPDWLAGDLAVLMEPTSGRVEAGCQGTLRVLVTLTGRRAHRARPSQGRLASHRHARQHRGGYRLRQAVGTRPAETDLRARHRRTKRAPFHYGTAHRWNGSGTGSERPACQHATRSRADLD